MPRAVPSQIVQLIDQLYPGAASVSDFFISSGETQKLAAILGFLKEMPSEFITLSGQELGDFAVSRAMLERIQDLWISNPNHTLASYRGISPVALLRRTLSKCPDEVPAPGTTELTFITDDALRDSIRRDISAANQDMVAGEWKGATVLAGSGTEALLLWAIQQAERQQAGRISTAIAALITRKTLPQKPNASPERWNFIELIEIARQMNLIGDEAAAQARLGKNFRNLIHPGRAARLEQVCDRATALSALAAVEHVARDLAP